MSESKEKVGNKRQQEKRARSGANQKTKKQKLEDDKDYVENSSKIESSENSSSLDLKKKK